MRPIFLEGKNIFLSPLSKEDIPGGYAEWLNNQEITGFMESGKFPVNIDNLSNYIDAYNSSNNDILLGIFLKKQSRHIGNITLHKINWRNRHAEIGILIGDKRAWGKGYATEALTLIVSHAFNRLNLHKLYAGMVKGNEGSKIAFEKIGFKVEGIFREHFYLNGKYHDCYRIGLLESEFNNKQFY